MNNSGNPALSALFVTDVDAAIQKVMTALRRSKGDVQAAAESLSITRRQVYRWMKKHPKLARELKTIRGVS